MNPFDKFRITSPYGEREDPITGKKGVFHTGVDIALPGAKSPVQAFWGGAVVFVYADYQTDKGARTRGTGLGNYGNVVVLDDGTHYHIYAHLTAPVVKVGETVQKGQQIGIEGTTGRSTGEHLHFEIRPKGPQWGFRLSGSRGSVDPASYLKRKGEAVVLNKDDANKVIAYLKEAWKFADSKQNTSEKNEIHRLANSLRAASGQPVQ